MNPQTHGQCANCGEPAAYTKLVCNRCGAQLPWVGAATSGFVGQHVTLQSVEPSQNPLTTCYKQRHLTALETLGVLSASAIILLGLAFPNNHAGSSNQSASAVAALETLPPVIDAPYSTPFDTSTGSGESANTAVEVTNPSQIPSTTRARFDKMEVGMTLSQVQRILGAAGKEVEQGLTGERGMTWRHAVYAWKGFHGADIEVTLRDNRLATKTIFGLY